MTTWVDTLKEGIPDYAKDTKLNLDAVVKRSTLDSDVAQGCALAAAVASGNGKLAAFIQANFANEVENNAAMTAASLMAMTNTWYPYVEDVEDAQLEGLPAQLRMNAIGSSGGTTKVRFEAYALAASIVGKCHFCIKAHYNGLKKEGMTVDNLRDIGRIASVINSVSKILTS